MTISPSQSSPKVYTVYSWTAKEGCDKEFVAAWRQLASLMVNQTGSTKSTRLFRDTMNQRHFLSVDSWENEDALRALQERVDFSRKLASVRSLLDGFSSWSLRLEAQEKA